MAEGKVIAVIGATGSQGGGLARAILSDLDGGFACRAVTRKPDSEKAQALKAEGAEVVKADLDDVAGLEKAFAGAYGAFCVTNFFAFWIGKICSSLIQFPDFRLLAGDDL